MWGRGALDMKGGVAMMLAAFMRAKAGGTPPPGDVILCLLADEEAGSELGASFIVSEHPELFAGVRYAIGEFGGFTLEIAGHALLPDHGRREAGLLDARALRGRGRPRLDADPRRRDGPAGQAARAARQPAAAGARDAGRALDGRGDRRGAAARRRAAAALLLVPALTDRLLDVLGERGRTFDPLLHNTASVDRLAGGEKINVIPGEVVADARLPAAPGVRAAALFAELRKLAGVEIDFELVQHDPVAEQPDLAMFELLARRCASSTRARKPVPMLLPGVTDGRFFSRLGIQTYGFLPMQLPAGAGLHAADPRRERARPGRGDRVRHERDRARAGTLRLTAPAGAAIRPLRPAAFPAARRSARASARHR